MALPMLSRCVPECLAAGKGVNPHLTSPVFSVPAARIWLIYGFQISHLTYIWGSNPCVPIPAGGETRATFLRIARTKAFLQTFARAPMAEHAVAARAALVHLAVAGEAEAARALDEGGGEGALVQAAWAGDGAAAAAIGELGTAWWARARGESAEDETQTEDSPAAKRARPRFRREDVNRERYPKP